MAPRRNTWHRSSLSQAEVSTEQSTVYPERPSSAALRCSKLSWQRSNLQPAGHSTEKPSAALSFSQQVAWIHKQGPVPAPALPRQRDFGRGPSRFGPGPSRGSQQWLATGHLPLRAACPQPSRPVGSRQWVRPSQDSRDPSTSRPAAGIPCIPKAQARAEASTLSNKPAASGSSAGLPQLQSVGCNGQGRAASVSKASSDSSLASAASSIQLTSQGIDSTRPQGAQVPVSSALQPRSSLQYANSRNGLALRRVTVSTKKAQRQQQHLMQHTLHQQPASQADAHPAPSAGSPWSKAVSSSQPCLTTPNMDKIKSRPLFTPPVGSVTTVGQPHGETEGQQAGSNAIKRKLSSSSTGTKRPRTSSRQMQSPSRSRKLQRLGNELYSSSGKGTLLRKGSKAISKAHSKVAAEGSLPVAKVSSFPWPMASSMVRKRASLRLQLVHLQGPFVSVCKSLGTTPSLFETSDKMLSASTCSGVCGTAAMCVCLQVFRHVTMEACEEMLEGRWQTASLLGMHQRIVK